MTRKADLRRHWISIRNAISPERRKQAADALCLFFKEQFARPNRQGLVLSFSSFGSEIDTHPLNQWLAEKKRLLLPRVENKEIGVYQVNDLKTDLAISKLKMLEPNPLRCPQVGLESIQIILVPGLAFDMDSHRLGYGQGHYDRLLIQTACPSTGIAFHEQKTDALPIDAWDVPLDQVLYF